METHDYFLAALAFLVSTIVMAVVVTWWLPQQGPVGYWIFLPFSLFLGFLTAGLVRQHLFSPSHD